MVNKEQRKNVFVLNHLFFWESWQCTAVVSFGLRKDCHLLDDLGKERVFTMYVLCNSRKIVNEIEDFELKLYKLRLSKGSKAALFSKKSFWILDWLTLQNRRAIGVCFRMNYWTCVYTVRFGNSLNVCRKLNPSFFKFTAIQWKRGKPANNIFMVYFLLRIWELNDALLLKTIFAQFLQGIALHHI